MEQHLVSEKALRCQEYMEREADVRHHTFEEENYQYELLAAGDPRALEVFDSGQRASDRRAGKVSEDPIRNTKYLTVVSIATACRAAMRAGLDSKRAYAASDLYIRKMDLLETQPEIRALSRDAFAFYLKEVQTLEKKRTFSRPIAQCLDYIYNHLHQPISLQDLADLTDLNPSYLSTLFREEMGLTVSDYIMSKKMEAARNMLKYTSETYAEISAVLNFSSQSHFIRAFKKYNGETPKQYREKNYRLSGN
ncbi:MAG: helix-turn-helix domain-containing protein [Oscillibacter sp.]|nr:helix-turn-helix domain-containing protein [Oscillibacter sp.]